MPKLFLSYASTDRDRARKVHQGLCATGLQLFCDIDPASLPLGQTWIEQLEKALEQSDGYLLLLSKNPISGWVRAELDYAIRLYIERKRQGRDFALIPLILDNCELDETGGFLGNFHAVRLTEEPPQTGAEFYGNLSSVLKEALSKPIPALAADGDNGPFPGLDCFREDKSRYFFGRDTEVNDLLQRLGSTSSGYKRWVVIEGPSGVGKSSLARAGLLPAVRRGCMKGPSRGFSATVMRPGRHPVENLAASIHKLLSTLVLNDQRMKDSSLVSLGELNNEFERSEKALVDVLKQWWPKETGLFFLVDQLEEIFTLANNTSGTRQFDALIANVLDSDIPFFLATTVRSDFTDRFGDLPYLRDRLNQIGSRYYVKPLSHNALRSALEGPAAVAGLCWEEGLAERVIEDSAQSDYSLSLIAHVLESIWKYRDSRVLTHRAYAAMGGVSGSLTLSADSVLDALGKDKDRARRLLLSLVKTGRGFKDTRRSIPREEALAAAGDGPEAEKILARLSGGRDPSAPEGMDTPVRLVVVSQSEKQTMHWVDLVHEVLLRHWSTLREWVEAERKEIERRDDLENAAAAWKKAGCPRDSLPRGAQLDYFRSAGAYSASAQSLLLTANAAEKRRKRLKVILRCITILGALAIAGSGIFAWQQRNFAMHTLLKSIELSNTVVNSIDFELEPISSTAEVRRKLLDQASELQKGLLEGNRDNKDVLNGQVVNFRKRGDLARTHDNLKRAEKEYQSSLNYAQRLCELEPNNIEYKRNELFGYERLGEVAKASGNLAVAHKYFLKWLAQTEAIAGDHNSDLQVKEYLATGYDRLGDTEQAMGNFGIAADYFKKGLNIRKSLFNKESNNLKRKFHIVVSQIKIGTLLHDSGDLESARRYFEKALVLSQELFDKDPGKTSFQRAITVSNNKLGVVALMSKDFSAAQEYFHEALNFAILFLAKDPKNLQLRRDVAVGYSKLGEVAQSLQKFDLAIEHFSEWLRLTEGLRMEDPENTELISDESDCYTKLGESTQALDRSSIAYNYYLKGLNLRNKLAEQDKTNIIWQLDLAISHIRLGQLLSKIEDEEAMKSHCRKASEIIARIENVQSLLKNSELSDAKRDLSILVGGRSL